MSTVLITIVLGIGLLGLAFAGIAVKIWLKKDGEFSGTCASNNPLVQAEGGGCVFCGAKPEEKCRREEVSAA
ncbi:MAG: membrane or secreted protein [Flavobacteriales bacterium]